MEHNLNKEQIEQQYLALEKKAHELEEAAAPVTVSNIYAKIRNIVLSMFALVFVTVMFYSASTFAYYSDSAHSGSNKIAAGTLNMEIIEVDGAGDVVLPVEKPVRIYPSQNVGKIIRIKNIGTLPMYIRVKIDLSIDKDESTLPQDWRSLITCNVKVDNEETGIAGTWEYRDGYYYYIIPLEPGMVATVFDTVSFSSAMGNEFTNSKINLVVKCQAIQLGADAWPASNATD